MQTIAENRHVFSLKTAQKISVRHTSQASVESGVGNKRAIRREKFLYFSVFFNTSTYPCSVFTD